MKNLHYLQTSEGFCIVVSVKNSAFYYIVLIIYYYSFACAIEFIFKKYRIDELVRVAFS